MGGDMPVYLYQLAGSIYEQLKLETTTFSSKQKAEENLESAFERTNLMYVKEVVGKDTIYKNEHGGVLVKIILAPNQPRFR